MNLTTLIHLREQEAQKVARARGRAKHWTGSFWVAPEDRETAYQIVQAGMTLVTRDA